MIPFRRRLRPATVLALLLVVAPALAQEGDAPAPPPADPPAAETPAGSAPASGAATAGEEDDEERRLITIDSSGGTQSGNLRFGPIHYQHPDPLGIEATVADLTIHAPRATLEAPPETLLSQAQGERTATFEGDVRVSRGRLEATGPGLVYREATGLGVMEGGVDIEIAPQEDDDDPTLVTAESAEFDVDTDRSVSRGSVVLTDGPQRAEADELTYAEARDLGRLLCEDLCTVVREDEQGGPLTITAEEIRVLTGDERLWARGNVTVVDGEITSTGDEVFYDDAEATAEVLGSPARSVDEAAGIELESDRIQQFVDLDYVEAIDASLPREATAEAFLFAEEDGAPDAIGDAPTDGGPSAGTAGDAVGAEDGGGGEDAGAPSGGAPDGGEAPEAP